MAILNLKNIIGNSPGLKAVLEAFSMQASAPFYITDVNDRILFGEKKENAGEKFAVQIDSGIAGWVCGDKNAATVAAMLQVITQKEQEKKDLGKEVLNMYQEVNLMFNFAEKLSQAIEPAAIAQITLDEAGHIIRSSGGWILLWDEKAKQLVILASIGENYGSEEKLNQHKELLWQILMNGQSEIMSDLLPLKEAEIISNDVQSLVYAALKVNRRIMGAIVMVDTAHERYQAGDLKLLTTLAQQSSTTIESSLLFEKNIQEAKEKEEAMRRIYAAAGKFVPFEFLRSLGRNKITDIRLGDQVEKIVTVLFSDIRGYTTLSEQMTPAENFNFVCDFNLMMGPIIRSNNGFINQYLGDAIMAIFPGSPVDALSAAVEMQHRVKTFNEERALLGKEPIKIGIGMHTGPLIMGITGDQDRMDAATISDTVNTASRIESLTKYYKTAIILSNATLNAINEEAEFHLRPLGLVKLRGKQETIVIHECFSGSEVDEIKSKLETLIFFREGIDSYLRKSFNDALASFSKVTELHPGDHTAKIFLKNITEFVEKGVPEDWAGIDQVKLK
jgi:adenylate cyclase